ncbi:ABC-three component system protein [Bradyrhizobium sp. SYSU BS000235]|uniref:ABC-three component system protein n=1 Tax=Bradyrhizobium sp. SYSU BS000235 TaxID=3411332 RepID=UPI003C724890
MIFSITSSIPTFKSLRFEEGLNILLADVTPKSTDKQTRNSAGKTSMIEIIHFLLGADADKNSLFKKKEIVAHSFSGEFAIEGSRIKVTRSGNDEKKILISKDHANSIGLAIKRDDDTGLEYVTVDDWKDCLGQAWFKIPTPRKGTEFEGSFTPSFRSAISYLIRRRKSGGYSNIQKQNDNQQPWDWQVNLSYLLGFDWKIPREIQDLRARKKSLSTLRQAIKAGELGNIFGTSGEIRPELVRTEARIAQLKSRIDKFRVLESYREMADEVSRIKNRMTEIAAELALIKETIVYLASSIQEEKPPAYAAVEMLYAEAGVQLPGVALRRFDEVREFQQSVVSNRRGYLEAEIEAARVTQQTLESELASADIRKSEILLVLDGKGAFEDLMAMHEEFATNSNRADALRTKLQNANILENKIAQTKRDSADLEIMLQEDHKRSENVIKYATVKVDQAIAELYDDRTGNLVVTPSKNGPQIDIVIQGGGNKGGIDLMKIFCFDTMLYEAVSDRLGGPGFLVHDSHLFDGVDARQVRGAIIFGAKTAAAHAGQYIIAMNSDELSASGVANETVVVNAILPVRLTDHETGGLFGFRFD